MSADRLWGSFYENADVEMAYLHAAASLYGCRPWSFRGQCVKVFDCGGRLCEFTSDRRYVCRRARQTRSQLSAVVEDEEGRLYTRHPPYSFLHKKTPLSGVCPPYPPRSHKRWTLGLNQNLHRKMSTECRVKCRVDQESTTCLKKRGKSRALSGY